MGSGVDTEKSPAPAVTRAAAVLDILAGARGRAMNLSELARELGAAKSSMANVCAALEDARLVRRVDSGFVLGRKTVELGGAYIGSFDQIREFYQLCSESPVLGRELVQIAMLDGTHVIYLARHEGRAPLRLSANIGDRLPASSTATGAALLADLSSDQVADRYRDESAFTVFTENSITTLAQLEAKLTETRARGYGLDDAEIQPGVLCMAVSIPLRASGAAPLAMGVTVLKAALNEKRRIVLLEALQDLARQLANPMNTPLAAAPGAI